MVIRGYSDSRIRLIRQKNRGVSAARNYGVKMAQAELIAFLDADDEWYPRFLEIILELRVRYPDAGIYGTGYHVFYVGRKNTSLNNTRITIEEKEISNYFEIDGRVPFMISSCAVPKNICLDVGGFPEGYTQGEDRCFVAKVALYHTVAYTSEIAMIYYLDLRTYKARYQKYVLESFSEYIDSCNKTELQKRDDYYHIMKFSENGKISISSGNLVYSRHNKDKIREVLRTINTPSLQKRKNWLYFKTYLPRLVLVGENYLINIVLYILDNIIRR